jgi:hypothetical protein
LGASRLRFDIIAAGRSAQRERKRRAMIGSTFESNPAFVFFNHFSHISFEDFEMDQKFFWPLSCQIHIHCPARKGFEVHQRAVSIAPKDNSQVERFHTLIGRF